MLEDTLVRDNEDIRVLRDGKSEEFNKKAEAESIDLKNSNLHLADLRGLDLREANLESASIHEAQISGTLFPENLSSEEIMLSVTHGCCMRVKKVVEI